jgi:ubiquinone/menaquinone biosynthesis C-methylase UbiE
MSDSQPIALGAYRELAEGFDAAADDHPHNAHLEQPAMQKLVPEMDGDRVLDAGCGAGHGSKWMADRGANVVALDIVFEMLDYTRKRTPTAHLIQADLGTELPVQNDAFDHVVSSLSLSYVRSWTSMFREFARVLRPGGTVTFSSGHPHVHFQFRDDAENYHAVEKVSLTWTGFSEVVGEVEVTTYRRPLEKIITPILDAGFRLEALREPLPTREFFEVDAELAADIARNPAFICVQVRLPENGSPE